MASNGYRPPYRQGPPPTQPRQYHPDQYERRDHYGGQRGRMYDQRDEGYDQYDNEQNYGYHNGQHIYGNGQWNNEQYHDNYYYNQHNGPSQQYSREPSRQQNYQYEDHYRMDVPPRPPTQNGPGRPPMQNGQRAPPPVDSHRDNVSRDSGTRQPKVRERILKEPESPKAAAWDNPFPTFPSKKKAESKKPDSEGGARDAGQMNPNNPQDPPRPSTSHSTRQRGDPPRPHTSHSQYRPEPVSDPSFDPRMPLNTAPPLPRPSPNHYQRPPAADFPSRPAPRRVMTGPAIPQPNDDFRHEQFPSHSEDVQRRQYPTGAYPPQQHTEEHVSQQRPMQGGGPPLPVAYQDNVSHHQRRSSDHHYRKPHSGEYQDYDATSYRGVPLTKKMSPDMPNFDAIPDHATEKAENSLSFQHPSQTQAYNKPTYQRNSLTQPDSQAPSTPVNGNDLVSPFAQFTFDIPASNGQTGSPRTHQSADQRGPQHGAREYPDSQLPPRSMPDQQMQFPVRGQSIPDRLPPNSPSQYPPSRSFQGHQPVRPFRSGLAQQQPPSASITAPSARYSQEESQGHEHNEAGYDSAPVPGDELNRPNIPLQQLSYQNDPSRQGYDSRIQPRQGSAASQQPQQPQLYHQGAPLRPTTSNSSSSVPFVDRQSRQSSDSYRHNSMQNPDSLPAHPAPFRPGLMQNVPPPPQTLPQPAQAPTPSHQKAPSGPNPPPEAEAPVTIRELNTLRETYKTHPDDYALGLKFAKRLVEAAKTLASESGRADPKQTAKNRERYIFDAHKVVKRLCGVGYAEAMFYFADCHGQGLLGLEPDAKEAFSLYQSAAKLGHAQAAYRVAVCCELGPEEGGGTRRDPLKAVQWYKRAASMGDTPAMYKMGMIQLKGLLGQAKNPREAISWLKRAAERADSENPHALHELGCLYENAQSTDIIIKDEKYALQLFQQAADLGYKYSQFRLGSAFEYGLLGLPIDPRVSIAYYSRAAKQGEHQAEFALSGWYLTGSGPPPPGEQPLLQQSDTEAYLWARRAASSGLAKAEYAMGYYTEVGIGVSSNVEEAKRWYYRAAAQNHLKARERLEELKRGGQRMQKTRVSRSNVGKHNEGECTVM